MQLISHAQDEPHVTVRHDWLPVQLMLQGPPPQVTFRQLSVPPHVIVHDLLPVQLMPLRHALVVEHAMLQLQPMGHETCCVQPPLTPQSIVQAFALALHDVHCAGHTPPSVFPPASTWDATQ